jgi:thymidylate synthase (FAD)
LKVTLVSSSTPSAELHAQGIVNCQELVAYCARVSNPSNQLNTETSEKLIRYLIKNRHWSPLEMVSACLEIQTTRDIARQILRHRSFSFQEFSQRYAVADLGFAYREARLQDVKNRQNSIEILQTDGDNGAEIVAWWDAKQKFVTQVVEDIYTEAIQRGIAKEQARAVLPEGITTSRLYMQGTIRSWLHYIELRSGPETQKEHRQIAKACAVALETIFPMVSEFLVK